MKVEHPHSAAQPQRTSTALPFRQLLAGARQSAKQPAGKPAPKSARQPVVEKPTSVRPAAPKPAASVAQTRAVSTPAVTAAVTQRQLARRSADAEAERLATVRASHHQVAAQQELRAAEATTCQAEKVEARVRALIVKELESAFDGGPAHVERAATCDGKVQPSFRVDGPPHPAKGAEASARAEQAVALIERIETFVRSSRPALALTLNNSLGARVEIERLGPGRVALKLIGQKGPPGADVVSRIRDELRARGLEVGALRVA
jgi:hypothetical protein